MNQEIEFICELDKLKLVLRKSVILDKSRKENSAEHSWHVAISALALEEFSNEIVDIFKVVSMLLCHDTVEIDAGDINVYDVDARIANEINEQKAADRIFSLLPAFKGGKFRDLWQEYEDRKTPEALFAHAIDRFLPVMLNFNSEGKTWIEHNIKLSQTLAVNKKIEDGSKIMWMQVQKWLLEAADLGWLIK